jgi:hypothetical protein
VARRIDLQRQDAVRSVEGLHAVLASYAGHLQHGAAWRAWEDVWEQYPWLRALCVRQGWTLAVRWSRHRLARASRFQTQYWSLARHAGADCLVFFPCGRFIEFYGPQRVVAAPALGLRVVAQPRARYAFTAGFPMWLSGVYISRAVRQGLLVVEVRQAPALLRYGCAPRLLCAVWIPTQIARAQGLGR